MKRVSSLLLTVILLFCFCGCSVFSEKSDAAKCYQSYYNSCQKNLDTAREALEQFSLETEEKPEYQNDIRLDSSAIGTWRIRDSVLHYPYLLVLESSGDCYVAGIKAAWYIREDTLHISISVDDSRHNLKYNTFQYSVQANTLYLDGNEYDRMTETPERSKKAAALVGKWSAVGDVPDDYPNEMNLEKSGAGSINSYELECLWCIEGDTFYLDTFAAHFSYTFRTENDMLYLDDQVYSRR